MGLSFLVIRVLPYDNHLYLVERAQVERIENKRAGRIATPRGIFVAHELRQRRKVRLRELAAQDVHPTFFYLDIHKNRKLLICKYIKNAANLKPFASFFARKTKHVGTGECLAPSSEHLVQHVERFQTGERRQMQRIIFVYRVEQPPALAARKGKARRRGVFHAH